MKIPLCPAKTPKELCLAVNSILSTPSKKMTCRPWNRFEEDTTSWWLVPSTEWPAYKHGKIFFSPESTEKESFINIGLFIEKGFDPSISHFYPSAKRCVMGSDWMWHTLLSCISDRSLPSTIVALSESFTTCFDINISGGYFPDSRDSDDRDSYEEFGFEDYTLKYDPVTCKIERLFCKKQNHRALAPLDDVDSIDSLIDATLELNTNDWLWVNFFPRLKMKVDETVLPKTAGHLSIEKLCSDYISHFARWLK